MTPNTSTAAHLQRSLRQCLATAAELLYHHGHVLETITLPHRGLTRRDLATLKKQSSEWATCQKVLIASEAAVYNEYDHFVLTAMGRELMFDMFGEGAADCA